MSFFTTQQKVEQMFVALCASRREYDALDLKYEKCRSNNGRLKVLNEQTKLSEAICHYTDKLKELDENWHHRVDIRKY